MRFAFKEEMLGRFFVMAAWADGRADRINSSEVGVKVWMSGEDFGDLADLCWKNIYLFEFA